MPPALSDEEMDSDEGVDMVPAKAKAVKAPEEDAATDEEEEDDEEEPDEYRVEKILKHDFGEYGTVLYQIKWLGYEKKSDMTWEPVENLENAVDILKEYHARIGGTPKPDAPKKKGPKAGSKRSSAAANFDSPEVSTKKTKRKSDIANGTPITDAKGKKMPDGSWENLVTVSSILEEEARAMKAVKEGKHKSRTVLMALLVWGEDGRKTQHPLSTARYKCPQRLLDYYERHLVFKSNAAAEEEEGDAIDEER